MSNKIILTISISHDLIEWVDEEICKTSRFASRSHAMEYALRIMKNIS